MTRRTSPPCSRTSKIRSSWSSTASKTRTTSAPASVTPNAPVAPSWSSPAVTDTVRKVAVGAAETMPIVQANNLRNALVKLKDAGVWLAGTSDHKASQSLYAAKLTGSLAIVLGAEGDGIRHLTAETCDFLLRIPMLGQVPCLNVSVSAGVCLFEAVRQRGHR
jgi:23S rRNA (guanosine2251-2'-O)-methyltransferase